ncbi:MAG: hypothetical protein Kow0027_24990 [Saprospiraceae bacterium]
MNITFIQLSSLRNALTVFTLFFLSAAPMFGQHELGLHFMRNVWHSGLTNPAIVQPQTLSISVLGLRNNLSFDGPTYNQIVSTENGQTVIDVDKFVDKLNPQNHLRDDLELNTVAVALKLGKLHLSLAHAVRYQAYFKYPKELPQIVWQGNAQFIGQTVELGNELEFFGYHELAAGAAYEFGPLTLGGRLKFLSGINSAVTDENHHSASFFTDSDVYQITLASDYILNSAGAVNYNGFTDLQTDFNFGQLTFDNFFSSNSGVAFDIGARLKLEQLELAASILDIGKITWDKDVTNYAATQTVTYSGLDFSDALTGDDVPGFDAALDTLKNLYEVTETHNSFETKLPSRVYLSAMYHLTEKVSVGALFFSEKFRNEKDTRVAIGGTAELLPFLTAGASYALGNDRFDNLGINVALTFGPVQLFAVTDNIFAALNAGDSKDFGARLGGRVMIGGGDEE